MLYLWSSVCLMIMRVSAAAAAVSGHMAHTHTNRVLTLGLK